MDLIVVVDRNWAIGRDGEQLVYISADLKRFKAMTMGKTVILGRKTLATFPGGKPLKGRRNLILSRNRSFRCEGAEVFHDLASLLEQAGEDAFVIGGAEVYQALLPRCRRAYVTRLQAAFEADRYFPNLDEQSGWRVLEESEEQEENGIKFRYVTYERA